MGGLGLTNAVLAYQQGDQWRQQKDAQDLENKRRGNITAANQAQADFIKEQQAQHEAQQAAALEQWTKSKGSGEGFQAEPFRPTDGIMFRAASVRGDALLKAGDFDAYAENRAKIIPMQVASRKQAWDKYQTDGDIGALGAAMYDTIPDGQHVVKHDLLDAAGPDGKKSAPQVRFQLANGETKLLPVAKVEEMAKRAVQDPAAVAKMEFERDLYAARDKIRVDGDKAVASHSHGLRMAEIGARNQGAQAVADTKAGSAERVAETRAGATVGAAEVRANAPGKTGGGAGGSKAVDLRALQQQRMRLDARRKEAADALKQSMKESESLYGTKRTDFVSKVKAKHQENMSKLDAEDATLRDRLEALNKGAGLSDAQPKGDKKAAGGGLDLSAFIKG